MARTKKADQRWLWYASRTSRCVPLDADAYPTITFNGQDIPRPEWVCQDPDGGLHIDHRVGRIDIEVAAPPVGDIELNWTCDYGVRVLAGSWLEEIADLIDEERTSIGELRVRGRSLEKWSTLHERQAPPLLSKDGRGLRCPICGRVYMTLLGRLYFADPTAIGRPLIVSGHGVFVREDLALSRNLRRPAGGFKPVLVRYKPPGQPF